MVCYRRRGHNEGDEPSFTQPQMYSLIDAKRSTRKLYAEALVGRGDITEADAEEMAKDFQVQLESIFNAVHNVEPESDPHFKAPAVSAPEGVATAIAEGVARQVMATQVAASIWVCSLTRPNRSWLVGKIPRFGMATTGYGVLYGCDVLGQGGPV